jgi:hypothetical protein
MPVHRLRYCGWSGSSFFTCLQEKTSTTYRKVVAVTNRICVQETSHFTFCSTQICEWKDINMLGMNITITSDETMGSFTQIFMNMSSDVFPVFNFKGV